MLRTGEKQEGSVSDSSKKVKVNHALNKTVVEEDVSHIKLMSLEIQLFNAAKRLR